MARHDFGYIAFLLSRSNIFQRRPGEYAAFAEAAHDLLTRELAGERVIQFSKVDNTRNSLEYRYEKRDYSISEREKTT